MIDEEREQRIVRARWILAAAINSAKTDAGRTQIQDMDLRVHGYAESGYPEDAIVVTGNWNDITRWDDDGGLAVLDNTPSRVARALEGVGVEIEWSDMWDTCEDCSKLIRTTGDSCFWQPSYAMQGGYKICIDCLNFEDYLESVEGPYSNGNSIELDPSEYGYQLIQDDFENGICGGQRADPQRIIKLLSDAGFHRFLLQLDQVQQFDMSFSVWLHDEEADEEDGMGLIRAKRILERGNTDGPDPAEIMKRGLEQASRQADEMRRAGATGTITSTITPDGVTSREVKWGE